MSASQGNGSDEFGGSGAGGGGEFRRSDGGQGRGGRDHGGNGRGGNGQGRKKRRRQRPQRVKHRKPGGGGGGGKEAFSFDAVNRERIFQQIEGLLRQIREHQEEFGGYTEEQLSDYTQAVTSFTRAFEEEGDASSERLRNEYLRVRDKLSNALRS